MRYYQGKDKRKISLSDWPTMLITFSICLFCWVAGYFFSLGFPFASNETVLPLWAKFCAWTTNRAVAYLCGIFCMILSAYVIQRICDIEMLIRERTRLVFIFFMLLTSTNAGLLPFKAVSIVLLCLVFMVYELFNAYQLPEATGKFFNVGALIGVAGLFMPQALWFLPLAWMGMYQFLSLSYRSYFASLIGALTIYWFVFAWCVWAHDFSMFASLFSTLTDFDLLSVFLTLGYYKFGFVGIVLLMIAAFFHIKRDAIYNRVRVRQMLSFLLNMSVWSFILICLYGANADSIIAVFYLPASVLIAYFFENMRHRFRFFLFYLILALSAVSFIIRVWNY